MGSRPHSHLIASLHATLLTPVRSFVYSCCLPTQVPMSSSLRWRRWQANRKAPVHDPRLAYTPNGFTPITILVPNSPTAQYDWSHLNRAGLRAANIANGIRMIPRSPTMGYPDYQQQQLRRRRSIWNSLMTPRSPDFLFSPTRARSMSEAQAREPLLGSPTRVSPIGTLRSPGWTTRYPAAGAQSPPRIRY